MRLLCVILISLFCTVASADNVTLSEKLDYNIDFNDYINIDYDTITPVFENNLLDQVTYGSWIVHFVLDITDPSGGDLYPFREFAVGLKPL